MSCARGCCDTQAEHFRSVSLNSWVGANSKVNERRLSADLDAYKRMRDEGLRPFRTKGARFMEQSAEIPQEIGLGGLLDKPTKTALKQGDGEIVGL